MNKTDDGLMREIDDAVRHDRLVALWKQYRAPLLAAAAALLIATTAITLWKQYRDRRAGEVMQQFTAAQAQYDAGDYLAAAEGFGLAADTALSGDLADMAELWEARALDKAGQSQQAAKALVRVATAPKGTDLTWRDLACLRLAAMDSARAGRCLAAPASPLAGERALVRASLLWRAGKMHEAETLLSQWAADEKAPAGIRERAKHYLAAVVADARS